jgi:hypothetical protein
MMLKHRDNLSCYIATGASALMNAKGCWHTQWCLDWMQKGCWHRLWLICLYQMQTGCWCTDNLHIDCKQWTTQTGRCIHTNIQ